MSQRSGFSRIGDKAILVNKLTVGDAVHIVRTEGGPISAGRAVFRAITILVVAAFTARAIVLGDASAWHLFLPMVGEYLVLMISLPVINLLIHDPTLRTDTRRSIPTLVILLIAGAAWIAYRAHRHEVPWPAQAEADLGWIAGWITSREMHWPILGASVGMAMSLPSRVAAFRQHGPPFVPVGIGCAMRVVVVLFGSFLIPAIIGSSTRITWAIWAVLLLSELGALAMHLDLQIRLKKRGVSVS